MPKKPVFEPFSPVKHSPLAAEHDAVARHVEAVVGEAGGRWYQEIPLGKSESGKALLAAGPEQARRYLLAALEQAAHWDGQGQAIRAQATTDVQRMNPHMLLGWPEIWSRRRQALHVVATLLKRRVPLDEEDLLALLDFANRCDALLGMHAPVGGIFKALERHAREQELSDALRPALETFARRLRHCPGKEEKRLATAVEHLVAGGADRLACSADAPPARPVVKAAAGSPAVMSLLKHALGLPSQGPEATTTPIGDDGFPLRGDSPLIDEHVLLSAVFESAVGTPNYQRPELADSAAGRQILAQEKHARGRTLLAAAERAVAGNLLPTHHDQPRQWQARYAAWGVATQLLDMACEFDRDGCFDILLFLSAFESGFQIDPDAVLAMVEPQSTGRALTEGERYVLHRLRALVAGGPRLGAATGALARLTALIGDGAGLFLAPGEAWSDAVNAELAQLAPARQGSWVALLKHLLQATAARPATKWIATAQRLADAVGREELVSALQRWLPQVTQGRTLPFANRYSGDTRGGSDTMHDENATCLRGLLWLIPSLGEAGLVRLVTMVAVSAYKKVPGVGPRAVKVGNACIYALGGMPGFDAVGQLALLKVRVRFGTAQKEIDKALTASAERLGLPRDEIEEMGVPAYGLTEVGRRVEQVGDCRAELVVTGTTGAELRWLRADGNVQKSIPAAVAKTFADDVKDLKAAAADVLQMLPAQRDRLDQLYLQRKSWPLSVWRERYLDHPLVGTLARRLIWQLAPPDGPARCAMWQDGELADGAGRPLEGDGGAPVTLWHPLHQSTDEVLAWRGLLERREVTQPFKQAHREIYVLTDAERQTRVYSNRFAAHILKQHQFNALCAARGWRNKLRLMVDDTYPPAVRPLPAWGLRAEFWVEGVGEDYGTATNESGVYLHVATDQVRFYRLDAQENLAHAGGGGYTVGADAEPVPLEQVPPLVLSEVMRDVDLFVGVASVGNDPAWADRGTAQQAAYWQRYSFGELSATAQTRREVLQRLIPRLKIAPRCSFSEKFLVVRGEIRTYKIHLGSGNILMEPDDQYLCIVPGRGLAGEAGTVFLPFEGDGIMAVILSKALLLAQDTKIADPTIVSQIMRR